jgi:signal transduction histidine kinase
VRDTAEAQQERTPDGVAADSRAELAALRREVARQRGIFDSARLIVGHELGRPLTAANGYLDLLEERRGDSLDDRDRAYIAKIRSALARLDELGESFVEMLRAEHGDGDLRSYERFDFRALADAVRGRFERDGARIAVDVPADFPPVVAQRRCAEIVLENLVSNAVKHGGADPVVIAAALAPGGPGGGTRLVITVKDRGAGIPEDKLEEIFTPFFRIESGETQAGLGLGLALVKSVVAVVDGEIKVRSKLGEGTAVTVVVPVMSGGRPAPDTVG